MVADTHSIRLGSTTETDETGRGGITPQKGSARAMTIKERLKVHAEIERENARKLREWKKGGKTA